MSIAIPAGASGAAATSMKRPMRRTRTSLRSARANATIQPDGQPSMPASQISRVEFSCAGFACALIGHHGGMTACRAGAPSIACGGDEPAGLLLDHRQLAGRDIEVGAEQRQRVSFDSSADERKCLEIVE